MSTTTQQPAPDFGEPWKTANYRDGGIVTSYDQPIMEGFKLVKRAVACVNACAGMSDPAAEIQALRDAINGAWEMLQGVEEHLDGNRAMFVQAALAKLQPFLKP